jgi:hypothetical protein
MARQGWGRHSTVATGSDSGDQVSVNAWNSDINKAGMLGFTGETIASATSITPTATTLILSGSTNVSTIAITNTAEYDLLYIFTSGSVTLVNTSSPSTAGDIKLLANADTDLSTTVPTILIRKGDFWYEYGGSPVTNSSITFAKIQDLATMKVIGRTAASSGVSSEVAILDEDNMASDSAVSLATQQSIKAYVDAQSHSTVTASSTTTFTNKTLNSSTNTVHADATQTYARNSSGSTITKGSPVYISGFDVGTTNPEISLADASVSGTMPCIGLVSADIANNATGAVIASGQLTTLNTSTYSVGDTLYVSETTGTLTATKPTGTALIQNIAIVERVHSSLGVVHISAINRSNDLPNIPDGKLWIGNSSAVPTDVTLSGDVTVTNAGVTTVGTLNQNTTGNAATATALATARTIGGTSFDGTANIAVALSATSTALATARTIGGTSFDGTANIAVALAAEATTVTDNSITLAKMAAGTDGNLITYDTNGDPAYVVTGTATHVLTSNGAGAAPTFQAAAGGGATIVHAFSNTTTTTYTGTASSFGTVGAGDRDIYIKKIDANNEGVFTKIWKNGAAVEVQIA